MRYEVSKVIKQHYVMDLVFGNSDCPGKILGRHFTHTGQVIAAWHPDASAMMIKDEYGDTYMMDPVERTKIFAIYLPTKEIFSYEIIMEFPDGNQFITADPYNVRNVISAEEEAWFMDGVWAESYKKMGAHPMTIDGVSGVYFAVWAPSARRVSVVGEFNFWNGMIYPMNRVGDSGIFELFIPGVSEGEYYKYEIKGRDGNIVQKADPCGALNQSLYGDASVVVQQDSFDWEDWEWIDKRKEKFGNQKYVSIADYTNEGKLLELDNFTFKNFTHVLIGGSVEEGNYRSWTESGVYSIPFEEADLNDVKKMINSLHKRDVGVLLKCDFGYFHERMEGLMRFDGTSLYGFSDEKKKFSPIKNRYRFCYTKDEVQGYLFSAMMMWLEEFHADGFIFENMEEIVFPDWQPIQELIPFRKCSTAFFEQTYQRIKEYDSGILLIGETDENLSYVQKNRIRDKKFYDYYLDNVMSRFFEEYWSAEKEERKGKYYTLVQPFQKAGIEKSILNINNWLPVCYDETTHEKWKMASAYMIGMPGMKQCRIKRNIEGSLEQYVDSLFALIKKYDALQDGEYGLDTFEWINNVNVPGEMVSYIRKSKNGENLMFIANFSPEEKRDYYIGVPEKGNYKLILDSRGAYPKGKSLIAVSEDKPCDLRNQSIKINMKPYNTMIFRYSK